MVDLLEVMEEFLAYLRIEKNASLLTTMAYRSDINQLFGFLESKRVPLQLDAVSQPLVHKFLINLGETFSYAAATIARRVNCLRSFFNFCVDQEYILVSPMRKIKPPKLPKRIPIYLKPGELDRLLNAPNLMKEDELWLQDKVMFNVFAYCGVRRAELLASSWDDVDFQAST